MSPLPFRQVHLDFHTSPAIPAIGSDFDPDEFAATAKAAHINSMTVFAKCHHGYSYYPTKIGTPHPNLVRPNLLGEMIEALHKAGIRAPVTPLSPGMNWPGLPIPNGGSLPRKATSAGPVRH